MTKTHALRHDLKTPLTALSLKLQVAIRAEKQALAVLQSALDDIHKLSEMIDERVSDEDGRHP